MPMISSEHSLPQLSPHLRDRLTRVNNAPLRRDGRFILCWLHHAIRAHENPTLDVAIEISAALGAPVLVYQGLAGDHRFNSDRHHAFIMEGARDLQRGLARRGVAYAFHLPRDPSAASPLRGLLERACAFVTEDFPAPPFPRWTARLSERSECAAIAVDCACIAPMRLAQKRIPRAFKFRDAMKKQWDARLREPWLDAEVRVDPLPLDADLLGFEPLDLESADIPALCAGCDIDHGVPPVARVTGGSEAGYARWEEFKANRLKAYANRRNDAADMNAVSCLSPYLHHGHVSPMRIAREAREIGGKGAEKFLDELLVWREMSHNFCAFTDPNDLETLDALPEWARETLCAHESDEREADYSWETLSRGATGDHLWDAAQKSLLWNGELHNNLRMTWGKMIPQWTRQPEESLRLLIDLNHRFALDGNDPNSYGGLLWCLGQFDRPFTPEQPALGSIRGRSTAIHAQRLDPERYASAVRARHEVAPWRVGVIGAGLAGLACARTLWDQGCDITVFDRGRAPGGRMSTRRVTDEEGREIAFDHGAPFFTATDPRFGRFVRSWIGDGVCAPWRGRFARWDGARLSEFEPERLHVVGAGGMHAVCAHLSQELTLRAHATVTRMERTGEGWVFHVEHLRSGARGEVFHVEHSDNGLRAEGPFDAVVIAAPPPQALRVLDGASPEIERVLGGIEMQATWALMLALDDPVERTPDIIEVAGDGVIAKLIRQSGKPGADEEQGSLWVAHATHDWSGAHAETPKEEARDTLTGEALRVLSAVGGRDVSGSKVRLALAHRWRFARAASGAREACLFDRQLGLSVCGDAFARGGERQSVERAFLSGQAAAGRILSLRAHKQAAPDSLFA